jgi:branched-chain amino acid transport system substrate-binding protein
MQRALHRAAVLTAAVTALSFSLVACGDDSDGGGSDASSTISIGQVGNYSGAIPGLAGQGYGLQAWVKATNAAGGIDGHKIDLHVADAKGDPASEVSQVTQMISRDKVVAFAGMGLSTISGSAPTLEKQGVPVIGGNTNDVAWAVSPGLYATGGGLLGTYLQGFFAVPSPGTKTGLVYCKESAGCTGVKTMMFDLGLSKANGGDPVYSAEASLAAPSFTAQCIAAQQAGVQVLAVAFDTTNVIRLAKDCDKQGYHPIYAESGTVPGDSLAAEPAMEGTLAGQTNAPWFLTDGPIAEHRAAMEKYFPKVTVDSTTVSGWVAGVALGKAIENSLSKNPDGAIDSDAIKEGLGMFKDETLGGLTPPLTFTSSGVQKQSNCAFSIVIKDGKWTQNGTDPVCPPESIQSTLDSALSALAKG